MAAGWHRSAIEFTDRRATRSRWRTASAGSVFGTCCCAGKLRSPARVPKNRLSSRRSLRCQPPRHPLRPHLRPSLRAPPAYPCRPERGITAGRTPSWGQSPAKTAGDWLSLGERCERACSIRHPAGCVAPPSAAIDQFSRPAAGWSARNFRAPAARRRLRQRSHYNHAEVRDGPIVTGGHGRNVTACNAPIVTVMLPGGSRLGWARSVLAVRVALIVTGRHGESG